MSGFGHRDSAIGVPSGAVAAATRGMAMDDVVAVLRGVRRGAFGLTAIALFAMACGLPAARAASKMPMPEGPGFARLGPPDAPVKLFYETKGEGSPVLLIHGFGSSTFTWRRIAPALAETHKVIAVDLKGFGQSDKPLDAHYSIFDQAELIKQLILDNDLKNLTLVGHSYGGGISLMLALDDDPRLKGRIAKLVLLDTIAYPQNIPVAFKMMDMPLVSHLGVRMVPPEVQARVALKLAYYDDSKIGDEDIEMYAAPLRTPAGKYAVIHSARQIVPQGLDEISKRYPTIKLPTLIAWCDNDRIVPLEIGLELRRNMPTSRIEIIEKCGHMPQEEQPEATLRLIQNFLGR
ncbi:alpha/beta hydrolase [Methyloceanibacter sp.]|uniref:alpha/beta fold hydrolase n=1 Tax=Methyloceanibacter sp. TaxID=1965321 RepID=UPI002C229AE5|nr:alpha/beta hydrolase [Methyloceanibacter sp.]HML92491.1 alpha/beta hydrolase [Methyloceanibacter sp.]